MRETEYLEAVTNQMRCKRARNLVAEELGQHIQDQAAAYRELGMGEEEALKKAVEQMGDPVSVGTDMDSIHRPETDRGTFFFICFMSVFGAFCWILLAGKNMPEDTSFWDIGAFVKLLFTGCLPGILFMWMVMRLDYTRIGRHPFAFALILTGIMWGYNIWSGYPGNGKYGMNYLFLAFALFLFGAAVHAMAGKGYKGIFLCLFWLFVQTVVFSVISRQPINVCNFFLTGTIVMSIAAWKGWFGPARKKALLSVWGSITVPAVFLLLAEAFADGYRWRRIQGWLLAADSEINYLLSGIQKEAAGAGLLHGTGSRMAVHNQNEYFLISLIAQHGYLAAFLVTALFGVLAFRLLKGIAQAKNHLGILMGAAAVFSLMLPAFEHLLYNVGWIPAGSLVLPFFSASGADVGLQGSYCTGAVLAYYAAMGICLSVYRIRNVVSKGRVCYENV